MNRPFFISLITALIFFGSFGCATPEPPPEIEPPVAKVNAPVPKGVARSLVQLDEVAPSTTHKGEVVQDIRLYLEGKLAEQQGQTELAQSKFKHALHFTSGKVGYAIFKDWLASYVQGLESPVSEQILAKLVQAELQDKATTAFLKDIGLASSERLENELRRLVPDRILATIPVRIANDTQLPSSSEMQKDLNSAVAALQSACERPEEHSEAPAGAKGNFSKFWQGVIYKCQGKLALAEQKFSELLNARRLGELSAAHYWYASTNRINALRGIGKRVEAADEYLRLVELWDEGKLDAASLGLTNDGVTLQKINDALWGARYRGLVGDFTRARSLVGKALQWLSTTHDVSHSSAKQLVELKAEAYHILSFRVALEERKYDEAITYATLGVEIPLLPAEWKDRFAWYQGFYSYMAGNSDAALRYWEALFKQTKDESLKPQLHFWLAKLHYDAKRVNEGDFYYHSLTEEHPLNYYSVIAPRIAGFAGSDRWQAAFAPAGKLNQGLMHLDRFNLESVRKDPKVADLLLRAEVVIAAGLDDDIVHPCITELTRVMRSHYRMANEAYPVFVYLSRLQYAASQYVQAISLTSLLRGGSRSFWADWPDQLSVYFPQPYADVFALSSIRTGVAIPELMGISRQESSFRPHVMSGAGAIGMMQLIPVTARRMAQTIGLNTVDIENQLKEPGLNTRLGGEYLRTLDRYYKGFKPAVYAAYNAGEFAVDQWLDRRQHADVLTFIEMIPFSETKGYVRNVMRNVVVYEFLNAHLESWSFQNPWDRSYLRHLINL